MNNAELLKVTEGDKHRRHLNIQSCRLYCAMQRETSRTKSSETAGSEQAFVAFALTYADLELDSSWICFNRFVIN